MPNSPSRDTEGLFDIVGRQETIGSWRTGEVVDDLDDQNVTAADGAVSTAKKVGPERRQGTDRQNTDNVEYVKLRLHKACTRRGNGAEGVKQP